ncbi:choice-of-anchor D domain-containing protein [Gloeothece verrucosa]|uniref:Choice-of-anchor D domain-containing protein n=1 Tax=Gloeothece verrucosa (strain PCC 7822) TaxID=497965 RepID=E0U8K7_GLOV7|nr:choice-of-anchor D domain-containing protein [Gloeothece verrucosa]ADN13753.1 protein of unknown function DUF1555 [Gloeothece verrucosa PCC 7822]
MNRLTRFSTISIVTIGSIVGISNYAQAGSLTLSATTFGNYSNTGTRNTTTYLTGKNNTTGTTETNRSFFIFDLTGKDLNASYRTILNSQLILNNPSSGYVGPSGTLKFNVTNVDTNNVPLLQSTTATTTQRVAIFNDLGVSNAASVYGSTNVGSVNNGKDVTIDLGTNANANILAQAQSGTPMFAVGGALTLNGTTARQVIFNGSGAGTKQLVINYADAQASTNENQQFGNVLVGQTKNVDLTVTNSGDAGSLLSGSIGASSNPLITPTSGTQSFTNLQAGQSATRTFTFTPTKRSKGTSEQATIALTSNTKNAIANPLFTGFGVAAQNALTSINNNAGYVRIGTQANLNFNIQNVGDGNLSGLGEMSNLKGTIALTGSSSDFSATSGSIGDVSLADNVVKAVNLSYKPTDHGVDTQVVSLNFTNGSDDGTNQAQVKTVNLTGYGVGAEFQSSSAPNSTLDFGKVLVGKTRLLSLAISNATQDPTQDLQLTGLTLLDAKFEGPGAEAFSLVNFTKGTVLGAGQSLNLQLQFNPLFKGDFSQIALRILTDQGTAFGQTGQSFSYNIKATAIPEPNTTLGLLSLLGTAVLLPRKKAKKIL